MGIDNQLMTAEEVAEVLRVHPYTIRQWRREGIIKAAVALRNAHRYRLSDVMAALAEPAKQSAMVTQ